MLDMNNLTEQQKELIKLENKFTPIIEISKEFFGNQINNNCLNEWEMQYCTLKFIEVLSMNNRAWMVQIEREKQEAKNA